MDEVGRKNAAAVEQALRLMDAQIREQQTRIDGLNATVAGLIQRVGDVEAANGRLHAERFGTGPSVR